MNKYNLAVSEAGIPTQDEVGVMPMTRNADGEMPSVPGTLQTGVRKRLFDLAAAQAADGENEEAFAGFPTEDIRKRLEYARLEARARMMADAPDRFGEDEFGAIFKELNDRRFIADARTLAAFDALDGEGKVTNLSRLKDFLAFSDRLSAAKSVEEQQTALDDKFASPELKAWREATALDAPDGFGKNTQIHGPDGKPVSTANRAKIARGYFDKNGRSWGDRVASLRGWVGNPNDWIEGTTDEWFGDHRAIAEYEKVLQNDVLRAEAAKVMPYLSDAQRNLVNLAASGADMEPLRGLFYAMKPQDREMMYSMCQAVRPEWDGNWLEEMGVRAGMGVRSAWRGMNRADRSLTATIGKYLGFTTEAEVESLRKSMIDDIHWAESVTDLKLKDPEGFLKKALEGYADSASLQYSMLGGEMLKRSGATKPGAVGNAMVASGWILEGYTAASMIGEQFDNMLLRGIPLERAAPLSVAFGLGDTWVETWNLGAWTGANLTPAQMKRVGIRAAFRAAMKMDGKEFLKVLGANARQAVVIAASELGEETVQALNKEAGISVAEGRSIVDAFTSSSAYKAGMDGLWEALPACTAFGVFGAANPTGSIAKSANGAYAEHLQRIASAVARRNGMEAVSDAQFEVAQTMALNEAARVVRATAGMSAKERNAWINAQKEFTPAEKQFYAEHCEMYAASVAQDGKAWADAHLSGSVNEAMFAKAGWKFAHDEAGNITSVTTTNGETIPVKFINREARAEDLGEQGVEEFIDEYNRLGVGEKLTGKDDPNLAKAIAAATNGWYKDGTITLFGSRATGAHLAHESTHAMIERLSDLGTKEARQALKAFANAYGGVRGKLSRVGEEILAYTIQDHADRANEKNKGVAPDEVLLENIGRNIVTAVKRIFGRGKGQVFLPVVRTEDGIAFDPEAQLLIVEKRRALAAHQRKQDLEAARRAERKAAAEKLKAERETKRQKKIEMRKAEALKGKKEAGELWKLADSVAKDIEAELEAEEKAELEAIDAKYEAEFKALQEEEERNEAVRKAEEERQAKMDSKMLENRKNASKEVPRLGHAKNQDDETAQRCRAAYIGAWKAKMGRSVSQEEVDRLTEVYGLPPEALDLKKTGNGYRLSDEPLMSDEAKMRIADGILKFYADLSSVKIIVPDVVVATAEDAANAVPNEVYDPVSDTFIQGRVVIDANAAKSLREQAGMEEPSVSPEEIEAARENHPTRFSLGKPRGAQKSAEVEYPSAADEIRDTTRFSIGKRDDVKNLVLKKRPDVHRMFTNEKLGVDAEDDLSPERWSELGAEKAVDEIFKFATNKERQAALHWFIKGAIRLPEDAPKVSEAIKYGENAKGRKGVLTDPMQYASPMAMMDALHDFKPKAKPIDPDKVPQLSDRRDMGHGVVTYLVQDDREGQQAMREIINTHWGEDANPWCLLHGDGRGNLSDGSEGGYDAWYYWQHYSALPKRVAFKDGRLLAFMATDGMDEEQAFDGGRLAELYPDEFAEYENALEEDEETRENQPNFYEWLNHNYGPVTEDDLRDRTPEQWWDRQDKSWQGIPLGNIPVPGDAFGRWANFEIRNGELKIIGGYAKRDGNGNDVMAWYADGSILSYTSGKWDFENDKYGKTISFHCRWGEFFQTKYFRYYPVSDTYSDGTHFNVKADDAPSGELADLVAEARGMKDSVMAVFNGTTKFSLGSDRLRDQVLTPEFKAWFGDSKVVDRSGNPRVVYHGTPNGKFWIFDRNRIGETWNADEAGFFFTSDRAQAEEYTKPYFRANTADPNLFAVYLSIQNPLVVDRRWWMSQFGRGDIYNHDAVEIWDDNQQTILDAMAEGGHDGVIIDPNPMGGAAKMYMVPNPTQIKSATDNTGAFDGTNPDIRFSLGGGNYGAGSSILNGRGFVDLQPGDTFESVERSIREDVNREVDNSVLGIKAKIGSNTNANHLTQKMSYFGDEDAEAHKYAAKNVLALFAKARLGIVHHDKKGGPKDYIRAFAPFYFGGRINLATITLRRDVDGDKLYTVEAVETNAEDSPRSSRQAAQEAQSPVSLAQRISYYVGEVKETDPKFIGNKGEIPFSLGTLVEEIKSLLNTNPDTHFSLGDRKAEYENALLDGDDEKAEEIVRQAAAAAMPDTKIVDEDGLPKVVYHRTENIFTEFDLGSSRKSMDIQGFFFYDDPNAGEEYGRRVYPCFLNITNPYVVDSKEKFDAMPWDMSAEGAGVRAREWLIANGYDGVVRAAEFFGDSADEIVALYPNQIKLSEGATYRDEYGEHLIELDERMNLKNPDIRFSLRTKEPPTKTGIGYKVFVQKRNPATGRMELYPPMVANPNGDGTPIGPWLDADEGLRAEDSPSGRARVQAGGKGTNVGKGTLAWRPGWHLGKIPYALQFNVGEKVPNPLGIKNEKGEVIKVGKYFPANFVWAEVEYADDVDYQEEADGNGINPKTGKFRHAYAGLAHLPTDGSYEYRTNPNPATDPWVITGAMRIRKVLSADEVDEIVRQAGRKPQEREDRATNNFVRDSVLDAMPEGYAGIDAEGRTRFSIATYRNGGRDTLVKWMFGDVGEDILKMDAKRLKAYIALSDEYRWMKGAGKTAFRTKLHPDFVPVDEKSAVGRGQLAIADAVKIVRETDRISETASELAGSGKFKHFSNWSEATVETDGEGNPIFGVVRPNGDYAYNLDFSTVCKKRRPLDRVFASLVEDGTITDANIDILLSEENIPKIQDIIKKHGLEVACALCFVDSKRYKIGEVAKNFSTMWNNIVKMYAAKGDAWRKALAAAHRRRDEKGAMPTFYDRAVMLVDEDETARVKVDASWLVSGEGMDEFVRKHPAIHNLYRSFGGVSKAKDAHADVARNNDIIRPFAHYTNPKSSMTSLTREKAYAVGGVRLQSFTDFIPALFFDYAQMTAELAAKHLPLHTYTKEVDFVKLFGQTGMKMNMSLVPGGTGVLWMTEAEGAKQGLVAIHGKNNKPVKRNGKVAFYDLADECFPVKEAFALRKGSPDIGTIMVGVSDEHISLMLDDPRIDMVIPYHKSSLNGVVAAMRGIDGYRDYTDSQSTKKPDGAKDFDFYADLARTKDPRKTAANYLKFCEESGFTAKFADFGGHPNYYKLLADFRLYRDDGKTYAPQRDVTQTYPKNLAALLKDAMEHDQRDADALDRETEPVKNEVRAAVFNMGERFKKAKAVSKATRPGRDTRRFSIGNRSAENVAKLFLAREIMENNGRLPDTRRATAVARGIGYNGSMESLLNAAAVEANEQTRVLRYLASDPKTEKILARAGLAVRNERAIERARAAAIQFSREVSEARETSRKAVERAVRSMRGEDYDMMLAREGLDLNAILLAIRPEERETGEAGEAKETPKPVALAEADRELAADLARKAVENGVKLVEQARAAVAAKDGEAKGGRRDEGKRGENPNDDPHGDIAYGNAISAAMREAITKAGLTLESPEAMVQLVKAVTEKYIRDYASEFKGVDLEDIWNSPLARAKFAANLASFAKAVASAYAPSYARVRISQKAQLLNDQGLTTMRMIEEVGEELFRDLHGDIIRQSRESLIGEIKKLLKPHATHYSENQLKQDRKGVDSALGRYCKIAYRCVKMSAAEVEERARELEDELATWAGIAEDEAERYREFAEKKMELEMLDMFGNLKSRMPAELQALRDFVEQTINESRWETMQFGEKWEESRVAGADAMMSAIEGNPKDGGVMPEDDDVSGLYSLIGMMETKARQLTRFCKDGAKRQQSLKAFSMVEEMIQAAEDRQYNFVQMQKAKFVDICKSVYGSEDAAATALSADIDRSLWAQLDRGEQKTAWTIGRVMQMYVSCVQADYADNCAKYGRDGDYVRMLEQIINSMDPRHMDFIERMRGMYMEQGDALSEVLERTTGTRLLTPNRLYMPVKMLLANSIAQKSRARAYNPFAPSLTPRVKNGLDFDQTVDIVDMWQSRLDDTAHTIAWADTGSMVQGICLSDRVLKAIRQAHGTKVMRQWNRYILDILAGAETGKVDESNWGVRAMRFCARLASRTWLMLNPASWSKQLAAVPCFALSSDGSLKDVAKSIAFCAMHPFQAAQVMRDLSQTDAFKARYGVAISQEMKYATSDKGRFNSWIGRLVDFGMAGTMKFDMFGVYILSGVYHNRRCELESQGKSKEEASEIASSWLMHIVDKTAQTTRTVNTTELQRAGGAWGILLQFKSAPAQQTQFEITAIQDALAAPNDAARWKKAGVAILINHLIVPTINTAIESVLTCLTGWGIPDDEKRQRLIEMWIANCVSGSLGSIVFLGTIVEAVGNLVGKVAVGEKPNAYDLRNSVGRQIPAAEMVNLWLNQGDKAIRAFCEITEGDIQEGCYDMVKAVTAVTPGLSWLSRKGFKAYESATDK